MGFDVLGAVIQRATQMPLDEFMKVRAAAGVFFIVSYMDGIDIPPWGLPCVFFCGGRVRWARALSITTTLPTVGAPVITDTPCLPAGCSPPFPSLPTPPRNTTSAACSNPSA